MIASVWLRGQARSQRVSTVIFHVLVSLRRSDSDRFRGKVSSPPRVLSLRRFKVSCTGGSQLRPISSAALRFYVVMISRCFPSGGRGAAKNL